VPALLLTLALFLPGRIAPAVAGQEAAAESAPASEAELAAVLLERKDDADPELVRRLANLRSEAALDGLLRFYDAVGSRYMRRIVLRAFARFEGVPEAEARAFQKLTDVGTLALEPELRETAIDELADCPGARPFLAAIITSTADDAVRERALRHHVAGARPEEVEWYLRIYESGETKKKDKRDKARDKGDKEKDKASSEEPALYGPALKEIAFEALAASRTVEQLVEATESKLVLVRRRALEELAARRAPETSACAERLFERHGERPDVRLMAAEVLLSERGAKFAQELYKGATRGDAPLELVLGLADMLAALDDASLRAQALKNLGSGRELEKRFHLRLTARIPDPKVDKALLELSKDKERSVAADALRAMGVRGNPTFVPRLEQVLAGSADSLLLGMAMDSLEAIQGREAAWQERLVQLSEHADGVVRNAALEALGRTKDPSRLAALEKGLGHPDWTTRLAAARGLEALHVSAGVGALCQRVAEEDGRVAADMADILWRLTAQPFRADGKQWKRWWEEQRADFRFPTAEELQKRQQERDLREAKQVSRSFRGVKVDSRFFGLRITSHRVAFVIDVSGSMDWRLGGQNATEGPQRIDVAKKELLACLEALEAGTHFNIYPFSDGVTPWKEAGVECTEETFTEAREFVEELGAFGGTNVHGGLQAAFEDPSVDTIFFLSDGEPSVGEVVDPAEIREAVQAWNLERGVVIHTISIGDRFPLLEWLAEDSKGAYRTYP
jgi:HEAT repeat protein